MLLLLLLLVASEPESFERRWRFRLYLFEGLWVLELVELSEGFGRRRLLLRDECDREWLLERRPYSASSSSRSSSRTCFASKLWSRRWWSTSLLRTYLYLCFLLFDLLCFLAVFFVLFSALLLRCLSSLFSSFVSCAFFSFLWGWVAEFPCLCLLRDG